MKKTILSVLAAIGFFILSSSQVLAQAQVYHERTENDLGGFTYFTCDGTPLTIEGSETMVSHTVINENRATLTLHTTATTTATDASGTTYVGTENTIQSYHSSVVNGAFTVTSVSTIHYVSQGAAPNFSVVNTSKLTFNANGEITVDRSDTRISCE